MAETTCPRCNKEKKPSGSGRMTEWISVCTCDATDEIFDDTKTVRIHCQTCGKPVAEGRQGSFTQFVFRSDVCSCERPKIPAGMKFEARAIAAFDKVDIDELEELDIPDSDFPKDRFKPIELLGKGSSGVVYLAVDSILRKKVVVKVLSKVSDSKKIVLFQEEAKATSRLNHPNIVKVLDFGVVGDETPYMVLEYFAGISLKEYIEEHGKLDWLDACIIFEQIASAIGYANSEKIYHRDIKPGNIIISTDGDRIERAQVIDFGLAKMANPHDTGTHFQAKTIAGTPAYMSPDRAQGLDYTQMSEVYSLGCVLFECLAGRKPFISDSPVELIQKQASEAPPKLVEVSNQEIPSELIELVEACLEKDPASRPETLVQVANTLEQIAEQSSDYSRGSVLASSSLDTKIESSSPRRFKWEILALVLLSFGVISFIGLRLTNMDSEGEAGVTNSTVTKEDKSQSIDMADSKGITNLVSNRFKLANNGAALFSHYGKLSVSSFDNLDTSRVKRVDVLYGEFESDEVFEKIGEIPNLEVIAITGVEGVTKRAVQLFVDASLKNKQNLTQISFAESNIVPGSLIPIGRLPHVWNLIVNHTDIGDQDMLAFSKSRVKVMVMLDTKVTGYGLISLAKMKTLKSVVVKPTKYLTADAIVNFRKARPDIGIFDTPVSESGIN